MLPSSGEVLAASLFITAAPFAALEQTQRNVFDITQTVAMNAAKRVLGRSVSMRTASDLIGSIRRSASDKSAVIPEDLAALEHRIRQETHRL